MRSGDESDADASWLPPRERAHAHEHAPPAWGALAFGLAAALGVATAWGFSVDDALISARVAHHLASGVGYRFNPSGPSVDCVTPLGWAWLLAPLARDTPWQAVTRASVIGAALWVGAAAWLGRRCALQCWGWRLGLLAVVLGSCLPLGAWATSGMETALVMVLGTFALVPGRWGAAAAGVAAAWRPELVPWAVALGFGLGIARRAPLGERAVALALVLLPALGVALCRAVVFGHPAPLAVIAKPSDLEHGLRYAFGALALAGPPYLLAAWGAWRTLPRPLVAMAFAFGLHVLVLAGVGGDWMPFWRLAMPALPGVFVVGAALLARTRPAWVLVRLVPVLGCAVLLHVAQGRATRAVRSEREQLLGAVVPLLAGARRVASLDVGWVGAAGDYDVVDLAGVTDPEVAYLPGGHTSKRLPADFLERRNVDALVLLANVDATAGLHAAHTAPALAGSDTASAPTSEGSDTAGAPAPADATGSPASAGLPTAGTTPTPAGSHAAGAAGTAPAPGDYARQVEQRLMGLRGAAGFAPVGILPLNPRQAYVVLRRPPEAAPTSEAAPTREGTPPPGDSTP